MGHLGTHGRGRRHIRRITDHEIDRRVVEQGAHRVVIGDIGAVHMHAAGGSESFDVAPQPGQRGVVHLDRDDLGPRLYREMGLEFPTG